MKVKIYSTPTCPYCRMAKEYLKEKKVAFEDLNVAADKAKAQEMIDRSGQMGVPVIDVGGKLIVGFDKEELEKLLPAAKK
jgi:glutaredoxin 3